MGHLGLVAEVAGNSSALRPAGSADLANCPVGLSLSPLFANLCTLLYYFHARSVYLVCLLYYKGGNMVESSRPYWWCCAVSLVLCFCPGDCGPASGKCGT